MATGNVTPDRALTTPGPTKEHDLLQKLIVEIYLLGSGTTGNNCVLVGGLPIVVVVAVAVVQLGVQSV